MRNQRQRDDRYNQPADKRQAKAPGLQRVAFARVERQRAGHGTVRDVNRRIDQTQDGIGYAGIDNFRRLPGIRYVEGNQAAHAKRNGKPEQPGTKTTVAGLSAVHQRANARVDKRIDHAHH